VAPNRQKPYNRETSTRRRRTELILPPAELLVFSSVLPILWELRKKKCGRRKRRSPQWVFDLNRSEVLSERERGRKNVGGRTTWLVFMGREPESGASGRKKKIVEKKLLNTDSQGKNPRPL
jgi:hypothetical protein